MTYFLACAQSRSIDCQRQMEGNAARRGRNPTHRASGSQAWAKANRSQFQKHDAALIAEANAISAQFPGMIDPYARHDEADRYVIALAKLNGWAVVTHETPARSKKNALRTHFIPDVCSALNVRCIDFLDVMRRENWVFR